MSEISQESAGSSRFHMIDVGAKVPTRRRAVASGRIWVGEEAYSRIRSGKMPKGDLLALAEVAGVQAAKRASEFIPLCHPLGLDQVLVRFEFEPENFALRAICEAVATAKTGVEMEALAGAQAALLSVYDLTKGVNPALWISDLHLELKEGGKSGVWAHPGKETVCGPFTKEKKSDSAVNEWAGISASVITSSDRVSKGLAEDRSGPTAVRWLQDKGVSVSRSIVVADEIEGLANAILERTSGTARVDVLVISGGTGLGPRDVTPESLAHAAAQVGSRMPFRKIPGVGELLRSGGSRHTPTAWLSRSEGAFLGRTLVILLPGSPKAVVEGLEQLQKLIPHLLQMSRGGGHS
ncbi:MAG: hypothetical protein A2X94_07295 [Bdellovibrionales bacterium GWB1_55_8]|nr:MAG: hypothetical protein A2X94_07295 [Bdellovibrionales bacterium GWB1_55_8]